MANKRKPNVPAPYDVNADLHSAITSVREAIVDARAFTSLGSQLAQLMHHHQDLILPTPEVVIEVGSTDRQGVLDNLLEYSCRYGLITMLTACEVWIQELVAVAELVSQAVTTRNIPTAATRQRVRRKVLSQRRNSELLLDDACESLGIAKVTALPRTWFVSLTDLRNCLVHRLGKVGIRDAPDGRLTVSWGRWGFFDEQGEVRTLPHGPGHERQLRFKEVRRSWRVGDSIALTAQDLSDIAFSLLQFVMESAKPAASRIESLMPWAGHIDLNWSITTALAETADDLPPEMRYLFDSAADTRPDHLDTFWTDPDPGITSDTSG